MLIVTLFNLKRLAESGDITIEILRQEGKTQDVVCSSRVLCLASLVWRAMFSDPTRFLESQTGRAKFHDDDWEAILIILNVAHLKYDTLRIVKPWLQNWQRGVQHVALQDGYEEWLFIA